MAWLRSREGDDKNTRIENRLNKGMSVPMPDINGLEYIVDLWNDAGTADQGMSGLVPLSSRELRSWRLESEIELTVWERQVILKMSRQYCYQSTISNDKKCLAPYFVKDSAEDVQKRRNALEKKMIDLF